jgi:hypothetical protein
MTEVLLTTDWCCRDVWLAGTPYLELVYDVQGRMTVPYTEPEADT